MTSFTQEEKKSANYIRSMLFDRMDLLSTPKAQKNNNAAITILERMMEECGIDIAERKTY